MQMFFVPSGSMRPLLTNDDRILVQKVSYWGDGQVERGDVVVFADPGDRWLGPAIGEPTAVQSVLARIGLYPTGGHLVKRVIGVGGDRVRCCDQRGRVRVNGVPLDEEDYLEGDAKPSERRFDVEVPEGRIWVMGDNRPDSEDSRFHQDLPGGGTVPESAVVGKVWGVVWPLGRFELLETPVTFGNPALQVTGARP
jgi:signal peptidase I